MNSSVLSSVKPQVRCVVLSDQSLAGMLNLTDQSPSFPVRYLVWLLTVSLTYTSKQDEVKERHMNATVIRGERELEGRDIKGRGVLEGVV